MKRFFIIALIFAISFAFSESKSGNNFSIINYGSFQADSNKIQDNNDNVTGKINTMNNISICDFSNTTNINASINESFGIEYICESKQKNKIISVTYRFNHPTIDNPNTGKSSTIDSIPVKIMTNEKNIMGWEFNEDYEIQKGEWKFQILQNDNIVCEKTFQIQ